jgi:DNA-binding GntR family transcriptional regulator
MHAGGSNLPIKVMRMGKSRTSHQKHTDRAYEKIRELILNGALAPGSRVVENELAERFDMSRTPVRSALHRLMHDGFILESSGRKKQRLIVSPLTKEDGREVYQIVAVLDGLAASMAAGLPTDVRKKIGKDMTATNKRLRAASRKEFPDPLQLMELHGAIHFRYYQDIRSPRLSALFASIRPQTDRYRRIYNTGTFGDGLAQSADEHEAMIRAIEVGDQQGAQHATEYNWLQAADRLCRVIDVIGEHGHW